MKKILCVLICCVMAVLILYGNYINGNKINKKAPAQTVDTAMGTIVNQTVYAQDAEAVCEEILEVITRLEQEQISWRVEGSQLYRINTEGGRLSFSPWMEEILTQCLEVSHLSKGAFDITIGPVVRLWDIDSWAGKENPSEYDLPTETEILLGLERSGYEKVEIKDGTIWLPEGMQLDLGAVGKGIALDEIRNCLEQKQEVSGVISVGGSILTYGNKPDESPWRVGIVNPLNPSESLGYLELGSGWCVSTSGDYERYVEVDGVRYHHIINPKTGYPAESGVKGVTILSKNGLLSDAMSTACFILGEDEGLELAETMEVEALFVREDGTLAMTEGMKTYFHLSKK